MLHQELDSHPALTLGIDANATGELGNTELNLKEKESMV